MKATFFTLSSFLAIASAAGSGTSDGSCPSITVYAPSGDRRSSCDATASTDKCDTTLSIEPVVIPCGCIPNVDLRDECAPCNADTYVVEECETPALRLSLKEKRSPKTIKTTTTTKRSVEEEASRPEISVDLDKRGFPSGYGSPRPSANEFCEGYGGMQSREIFEQYYGITVAECLESYAKWDKLYPVKKSGVFYEIWQTSFRLWMLHMKNKNRIRYKRSPEPEPTPAPVAAPAGATTTRRSTTTTRRTTTTTRRTTTTTRRTTTTTTRRTTTTTRRTTSTRRPTTTTRRTTTTTRRPTTTTRRATTTTRRATTTTRPATTTTMAMIAPINDVNGMVKYLDTKNCKPDPNAPPRPSADPEVFCAMPPGWDLTIYIAMKGCTPEQCPDVYAAWQKSWDDTYNNPRFACLKFWQGSFRAFANRKGRAKRSEAEVDIHHNEAAQVTKRAALPQQGSNTRTSSRTSTTTTRRPSSTTRTTTRPTSTRTSTRTSSTHTSSSTRTTTTTTRRPTTTTRASTLSTSTRRSSTTTTTRRTSTTTTTTRRADPTPATNNNVQFLDNSSNGGDRRVNDEPIAKPLGTSKNPPVIHDDGESDVIGITADKDIWQAALRISRGPRHRRTARAKRV